MTKLNYKTLLLSAIIMAITFTSCQAIGDIFKTGVWFGVIIVIVIVIIIFWIISKAGKKS